VPGNGIRATKEIRARLPGAAVVMLSNSRENLLNSLRAGAIGYLLMDTDPARLPHVLRGVLRGEAAVPRCLVSRLIDELRSQGRRRSIPAPGRPAAEVTSREWEVLSLMREGLTTAEVAVRLAVSPVTVRRHASTAVKKLGLADRKTALGLLNGSSY
jgi:DNA-binding NarL/FixJ family response regulator